MNDRTKIKFRSFIAYTLSQEIVDLCGKIQAQFPNDKNILKFVRPENMHLTILFLGDKTIEELNSAKNSLSGICAKVKEISFTFTGMSIFGRPPSVIYLEISDRNDKGKLLSEEICNSLNTNPDKPWVAHITLARIKSYNKKFDVSLLNHIKVEPITFSPSGVTLFTSKLTSKGPGYKEFYNN